MAFFPEQEYKVSTKSEEELRRFTLEEDLSELQRSYILLTKGSQLQKKAIYQNLYMILRDPKAFDNFFKVLREEVQQQEEEYQIICAASLKRFLEGGQVAEQNILHIFVLTSKILTIWSQSVLDAWYEVLDVILHIIQIDLVLKDVTQLALTLSDATQPTVSRYIACRIIGSIGEILRDKIKGPLFDKARILCQDPDTEIRRIMSEEVLLRICQNISTDMLETYMLEKVQDVNYLKILELVYDADINVKGGAVCTLFKVAKNLSVEERKQRIVKIFYDLLVSPNEEMVKRMSSLSGPTFEILHQFISKNLQQHLQFLGIFREYGLNKNPQIRLNFAYNLPGVLMLSEPKKFDFFQESYIKCLSNNQHPEIQRTLVCSFGDIIRISPHEFLEVLGNQFINLLQSENEQILEKLLPKYQNIIMQFAIKETQQIEEVNGQKKEEAKDNQETIFKLFVQIFEGSFEMLGFLQTKNLWNLQQIFFEQFFQAQDHFQNGTFNFDLFQTQVYKSLMYSTREVRRLCCFNLAKYASWIPDLRRRNDLFQFLFTNLYESNSYHLRIAFIDFIEGASSNFSRKFFLQQGFFRVLSLASDKVSTVQLNLTKILPQLQMKIHPDDEVTFEQLGNALNVLVNIKQKWISNVFLEVKKELDSQDLNDPEYLEKDILILKTEEDLYFNDLKARQDEDQQKDDFDINIRSDFVNEYLSKYKKRYTVFGNRIVNPKKGLAASHSYNSLSAKTNTSKMQQMSSEFTTKTIPVKKPPLHHESELSGLKSVDPKKVPKQHIPNKSTDHKIPLIKNSPEALKFPKPNKMEPIQSFKLPSLNSSNGKK